MIGYLDCSTGVSGDKLLGALLSVGTQTGEFTAQSLSDIGARLAPEARVTVEQVTTHGITATAVRVAAGESPNARHLRDITAILAEAGLPEPVHRDALLAFTRLAEAEAEVHGTTPDDVHFHEVGAADALIDIVGVFAGIHALALDRIVASPMAVGSGYVTCSHGVLPVPAPATARLLLGVPIHGGSAEGELTTPTGAVLISGIVDDFGNCPPLVPRTVGYGAGTRDIGVPNVCRLTVGETDERNTDLASERVSLLETNIDHISPEASAFAAQQLLAEGCLDAWIVPIVMKKGRAAMMLSVLTTTSTAERVAERIVMLTGSLGVRRTDIERFTAHRESRVVETPYGVVRVKAGPTGQRPEYDDVARIARETARPFDVVARELDELISQ